VLPQLNGTSFKALDFRLHPLPSAAVLDMVVFCFLIARKYKTTISSTKTKSMAMCGNYIQRVKIVINSNIIEQVTDFK